MLGNHLAIDLAAWARQRRLPSPNSPWHDVGGQGFSYQERRSKIRYKYLALASQLQHLIRASDNYYTKNNNNNKQLHQHSILSI